MLLECFDAPGDGPRDARARADLIRAAGLAARVLWIRPENDVASHPGDPGVLVVRDGRAAQSVLERWLAENGSARVVVAAVAPEGRVVSDALPDGATALWWPTGLARAERRLLGSRAALEPPPGTDHPLDWCLPGPLPGPGTALPLWDGPYVLVAGTRDGGGDHALQAFASVAGTEGLDLVVLADPDARLEGRARRLGVGTRVHFAGPAARGAEWAWLIGARAVVLDGDAACSGTLPWRALATGCPILTFGAGSVTARVRAWLAARDLLAAPQDAAAGVTLRATLARGPEVLARVARGRALARAQTPEALAARLAAALRPAAEPRTARAA